MSYARLNGSLPFSDTWSGYMQQAQDIPTSRWALLAFINIPVFAIVLNVLWQLVVPKKASDPPLIFHWLPFVGSAIAYGTDPLDFFFRCREKYGDVFTFVLLGRRVTVALGPKGNNFILGGKSTVFNAEEAYKHLTTPVFGKDVVYDVANEKFMQQKKFVKVGLTTENFEKYIGMFEEEVEDFLNKDPEMLVYQKEDVNEWGSFDAVEALAEITILTASRTLQGQEVRGELDKTFAQLYNDLDGGFTPLNFMFPDLPLPSYRRRDVAQKKMSKFYVDIIQRRRSGVSEHGNDMIEALLDQKYRTGESLPDHEIAHIMIALLMAGQHTSSATSAWTLLHIASDPAIAEALYQEQVEHFGTPDGKFAPMTYNTVKSLPVLDSVIRETLRIHPPIHSIMRKVGDDVPVPATISAPSKDSVYVVPKGTFVLASPLVSQLDPRIWADPNTWNPSRWTDKEGTAAQALMAYEDENGERIDYGFGAVSKGTDSPYQPFGAGRHRCIGEQFAYIQVGTIISTLIRHLEFRLEGPVPAHNYQTMILMPKKPRMIHYRRRRL